MYMVSGQGQTVNLANFLLIKAVDQIRHLDGEKYLQILLEEMQNLFTGQSFDLYWTQNEECPSHEEYMEMIRQSMSFPFLIAFNISKTLYTDHFASETGGLFRLLARLMIQKASALRPSPSDISHCQITNAS